MTSASDRASWRTDSVSCAFAGRQVADQASAAVAPTYRIPPSVLHWLAAVPADVPVAMLLRHSVRGPLPHGQMGEDVPLTTDGEAIAQQLGAVLGARLKMLRTSPVLRCIQTAKAVRLGAASDIGIETSDLLGGPGVYVVEAARAWPNWQTMSHEAVMAHLVERDDPLPGLARPAEAARQLVQRMLGEAGTDPGVHVFVTHDLFVTTTAARMLQQPLGRDAWPWFLEAAFFWRDSEGLHTAYRNWHGTQVESPVAALTDTQVIEFARREIARTVGLDSGARFFLAGGAFKSLLTGRAPRDLDDAGIQAEKVLLFIDLGALDLAESMLDEVLKKSSNHAQANYAYAMLYLQKMQAHVQQANHFNMMRTEIDPDHASHWVHDEANEAAKVQVSKATALQRLTRAYRSWPSSGTEKHRHWLDQKRRDHVLAVIVHLAFDFAHDHAGGDLVNFMKLQDRREGRPVEAYFSAEIDAAILAVVKEVERSQPRQMRCSSFERMTLLLQLYFALSPDEYRRFQPFWVKEFTTKYTDAIEAAVVPGWQGRNVLANVIREHLRLALGPDEIAALFSDVEARSVAAKHAFHADVLAFMNKVEAEDDDCSESFGDW